MKKKLLGSMLAVAMILSSVAIVMALEAEYDDEGRPIISLG